MDKEFSPQDLIARATSSEKEIKCSTPNHVWQIIEDQKLTGEVYIGNTTWWPDEPDGEEKAYSRYKSNYPGLKVRFSEPAGVDVAGVSIAARDHNTGLTQKAVGIFISLPVVSK